MSPSLASSTGLTGAARTSRGDFLGRSCVGAKGFRRRLPWGMGNSDKEEFSRRVFEEFSHALYVYMI